MKEQLHQVQCQGSLFYLLYVWNVQRKIGLESIWNDSHGDQGCKRIRVQMICVQKDKDAKGYGSP